MEDGLEMDLVNSDQMVSTGGHYSGQMVSAAGHHNGHMVSAGGHHNGQMVSAAGQSGQRRRRATASSTELYSVDDLPRVTHLNDSEVSSSWNWTRQKR